MKFGVRGFKHSAYLARAATLNEHLRTTVLHVAIAANSLPRFVREGRLFVVAVVAVVSAGRRCGNQGNLHGNRGIH